MKKSLLLLLVVFSLSVCRAGTTDTVSIYSTAMQRSFYCVVIKPSSYKKKKNVYPVVYLLHGYGGRYSDWIKKMPSLKDEADKMQLLIVCPDGGYSNWYFDSPVDSSIKYETYIAKEVPTFIDAHYRTIKSKTARAITGLSMGGHGALFLAFRHSETFGACGSMSGGMNLAEFGNKFDLMKRLGDTIQHAANWKNYSVLQVVEANRSSSLKIIFDCGLDDFFYHSNKQLHEKMLQLHIAHDYTERPGNHSWDYWMNSIQYHLLFFKNYFRSAAAK
ncbi:MAG: XynC protein [Chitinophagaceae bacterium]